jgi:F-type H+-transporting ATPase subunit b
MMPAGLYPGVPQEEGPLWDTLFAVDSGLAVWTVLTFLTLLAVLARYAWKPLMGALDAREKGIQDAIDEARGQREEAEKLLAQHREQLAEGRRQAQAILAESRAAADQLRKELEAKAREESQVILANARREIERERNAAVEAVRRAAVEVAMAAASRLLSERLDEERDRQLVTDYIDDLAKSGEARA